MKKNLLIGILWLCSCIFFTIEAQAVTAQVATTQVTTTQVTTTQVATTQLATTQVAATTQSSNLQESNIKKNRTYSTYYYQRASHFAALPASSKDIIFLGDSITDGAEWAELFGNRNVKNRGISGDTTWGVYDRLDVILNTPPKKIFLLIGINDIGRGKDDEYVIKGIERIIKKIRKEAPRTKLYVQSILPVNQCYGKFSGHTSQWKRIPGLNLRIREIAEQEGANFIDLFSKFSDAEGKMNKNYSNDGLHLLGEGYKVWKSAIQKYVRK